MPKIGKVWDFKDLNSMSTNELGKAYRTLAKRANQRLVNLERASKPGGKSYTFQNSAYRYVLSQAAGKSKGFIHMGRSGPRYTEYANVAGSSRNELLQNIMNVSKFLEYKRSTPGGIRREDIKRIKTFHEKYGLSYETIADPAFFDFLKSMGDAIGKQRIITSDTVFDMFIRKVNQGVDPKKLLDAFEDWKKSNRSGLKDLDQEWDRLVEETKKKKRKKAKKVKK